MALSPLEVKAAGAYAYARNKALDALRGLGGDVGRVIGDAPFAALTDGAAQTAAEENARTISSVVAKFSPQLKLAAIGLVVAVSLGALFFILVRRKR